MLLDKGVDLHSFQPTKDDIVKLSSCDMFIYVGGESDEWVEDALKEAEILYSTSLLYIIKSPFVTIVDTLGMIALPSLTITVIVMSMCS